LGHREYSVKDPRAKILQGMIEAYIKKNNIALSKRFEIALEVERVCEELLSDISTHIFNLTDFIKHIQNIFIGAAMQGARQSPYCC
jgi:citrate synthase